MHEYIHSQLRAKVVPFDCAHFAKIVIARHDNRRRIGAIKKEKKKRGEKRGKILLDIVFLSAREAAAFPIYLARNLSLSHTHRSFVFTQLRWKRVCITGDNRQQTGNKDARHRHTH